MRILLFTVLALISLPAYAARNILTTDQIYYVNGNPSATAICGLTGGSTCSAGNDSNNCLTPGTACLKTNRVIEILFGQTDVAMKTATINLAHGTSQNYAFSCSYGSMLGNITFNVIGDWNAPTAVVAVAPNGNFAVNAADGCVPSISSYKITDAGSANGAIIANQLSVVDLRSITIGGTWNTGAAIIQAQKHGIINMLGQDSHSSVTNTLDSTSTGQVFQVQNGGIIDFGNQPFNIPQAITLGNNQPFIVSVGAYPMNLTPNVFTGYGATHSTGRKCYLLNTLINTNESPNLFPGSTNCTNSTQ